MNKEIKFNTPGDFMESWFKNDLLGPSETKTFCEYYKNYYKNFTPFLKDNYNERLQEAVDIIKSKNGNLDVLDIGTGCGSEALYFASFGCNVLGIDLEKKRLDVANSRKNIIEENSQKKLPCNFELKSVFELNTDKKFDLIWMMETFHHIEPREKFAEIISKLLKKGGYLIISETNALNPVIQIIMFKSRGFNTKIKKNIGGKEYNYGRERILCASKLKKILEEREIFCEYIKYFRIFNNLENKKVAKMIEKILPRFFKPFFIHYNYIGKK